MQQSTQDKFRKVNQHIVQPMLAFYGGNPLQDGVVQAFVEDLGDFPETTLQAAWRDVRRTCKSRPNIAHFLAAIEDAKPTPTASVSNPENRGEYRNHRDTVLADRMMRSPVGQLALRLGVGQTVWMRAWRDGVSLTEADVYRVRDAWKEGVATTASLPGEKHLHRLYDAIQAREKQLHDRYAQRLPGAA